MTMTTSTTSRTHNLTLHRRMDQAQRARLEDSTSFLHFYLSSTHPHVPKALGFAQLTLRRTRHMGSSSHLVRGYADQLLGTSATAQLLSSFLGCALDAQQRHSATRIEDPHGNVVQQLHAHPSALLRVAQNALACASTKHQTLNIIWNSSTNSYRGTHAFIDMSALCALAGSARIRTRGTGRALHVYPNEHVQTLTGVCGALFSIKRKGGDLTDTHANQVQLSLNMRTLKKLIHAHAHLDPEQYPIAQLRAVHISDAQHARTLAF